MAAPVRRDDLVSTSPLESLLLRDSRRFSFVQAFQLLSKLVLEQNGDPDTDIIIRPILSLSPSRTEVASINVEVDENGYKRYELQTNSLGLYGANSPLPHFFTEGLIEAEKQDKNAGRLLLDVIHQDLFRLYYKALVRYRPMLDESVHHTYLNLFKSLIGVRDEHLWSTFPRPEMLFQYLNIFRDGRGSSAGLKKILLGFFNNAAVDIHQCVDRLMDIPQVQQLRLGEQANQLGDTTIVGGECFDSSGKFTVSIGPIHHKVYVDLIEDDESWKTLVSLIRYYLRQPLICELHIQVLQDKRCALNLGEQGWSQLGNDSWLFYQDSTPDDIGMLPSVKAVLEAVIDVE
jgi:type VI secretion system protein ImpH